MAPTPKPAALRVLDGTYRADRHALPSAGDLLGELPPAPADLNEHGQCEWAEKGALLLASGLLQARFLECLKRFCYASEQYQSAKAAAEKAESEGARFIESRGALVSHPAFREMKEWDLRCKHYLTEMGMTPSSSNRAPGSVPTKSGVKTRSRA